MKVAVCNAKDCGARMLWARTIDGKNMPVDVEPSQSKGNLVLVRRTEAEVPLAVPLGYFAIALDAAFNGDVEKRDHYLAGDDVAIYTSHFATCTSPDDFRDTPL